MPAVTSLPHSADSRSPTRWWSLSPRSAVVAVIAVSLALRLAWVAIMPLNKDEGYYYLYAVHPSWSYFDHPPGVQLVIELGLGLCGGAVNYFSFRFGFVLLSAVMTWVLARWTARQFGEWGGVYSAVWWNLAPFFSLGAGGEVQPDGPFLLFALLTIIALHRAVVELPGRTLPWVWVGLTWGAALLTKYHAVLLPAGAVLFVLVNRDSRRLLLTPGPYLAVLIGLACFSPVLVWNATHDWASFAFQGGRAVGSQFRPEWTGLMVLWQWAYLTPGLWVVLVGILIGGFRRWQTLEPRERLLICLAVVPLVFFLLISFTRRVSGHWTLVGFLPLMPLLARRCVGWYERWPRATRWVTVGWGVAFVAFAFLVAAHARYGLFAAAIPFKADPTNEQVGWDAIAAKLDEKGLAGRPNTFIFTNEFHNAGQLQFAVANRTPVLCYSAADPRGFAYWSKPDDWLGKDGVMVCLDDLPWEPDYYAEYFERIEPVEGFWLVRGGEPVRPVRVFLCHKQVKPFPYTYPLPNPPTTKE